MDKIKATYLRTIFMAGIIVFLTVGCNTRHNDAVATVVEATPTLSAYRELLDAEIRGIDPAKIEGYLKGEGLGMALPAELNSYPGPRHVLDLADDLELSETQTEQMQVLFAEMQPQAIELGKQILAEEAELEQAFRDKTIDEDFLLQQLTNVSELEAQLRYVHLRTHLTTVEILSPHQVTLYDSLRGYGQMPADHQHNQSHQ